MGFKERMLKFAENAMKGPANIMLNLDWFNDPFAHEVSWKPLVGGGSNFQSSALIKESSGKYLVKSSTKLVILTSMFAVIGLIVMGVSAYQKFISHSNEALIFPMVFGAVFFLIGVLITRQTLKNIEINLSYATIIFKNGDKVRFDENHALQIVQEYILNKNNSSNHSSSRGYYSYELNVILKNKERQNLMDHSDLKSIRIDAQTISSMVGVPLWDATDERCQRKSA